MSSKHKTRSWMQAVARENVDHEIQKRQAHGAASTASNDLSVCAARRHRLALQVPAGEFESSSGRGGSCYPSHCRRGHSEKTANDRWGDIMARAGPYQSWRWRLGPARFGSYRKRHRFASVSTARAAYHASGLGRCDGRHRLLFEYSIIFWTPRAPMHFTGRNI
jgi:hypothetical protein